MERFWFDPGQRQLESTRRNDETDIYIVILIVVFLMFNIKRHHAASDLRQTLSLGKNK
ncbi:hypothetical protein OGY35_02150 [Citrobacter sp. Ct235]|uniref:hypothetical protein n=1 Tax=Citrobacter sp. Ct235 TaxID=2985157 RepID=UPI002577CF4C|nr:hypothetical protein [Citrobacter sp. Ct235]MDM2734181.1 hypothetical protein [Citrobacter sp. Ct235]